MRKRRFKIIVSMAALVLLMPIALLWCERVRGSISLARYKRELIGKGEKLSARDFSPQPANGENAAPEILDAIDQLRDGAVLLKRDPPRMKITPAGRAVVCFREAEWVEAKVTNRWEPVAAGLEANEPALERIRAALEKPVIDNQLDYSQGFNMRLTHLAPAKLAALWFGAEAQLELHQGNTHEALKDLIAQVRITRMLARDRKVISELVRIAIAAVARTGAWEALQADGWSDQDLARLQESWENPNFATAMVNGLQGELVFADCSFQLFRDSNAAAAAGLFRADSYFPDEERPFAERTLRKVPGGDWLADFLNEQLFCRLWRFAWLDQAERHALEQTEKVLTVARAAATEKSCAQAQPAIAGFGEEDRNRNIYDKLRFCHWSSLSSLARTVDRAMRAETEKSLVICAIALRRYSLRHGKAPASLDSLVPDFLSAVPVDYMDGRPVKYRLNADGTFTLYSVGQDGKDDGGDASLLPSKTTVRNLWDRKDFVWPAPALPEEIEAHRKEAS